MPKLNILRVKLFKNFEFDFLQDVILFNFASKNTSWVLFSNVLLNTFNSLKFISFSFLLIFSFSSFLGRYFFDEDIYSLF